MKAKRRRYCNRCGTETDSKVRCSACDRRLCWECRLLGVRVGGVRVPLCALCVEERDYPVAVEITGVQEESDREALVAVVRAARAYWAALEGGSPRRHNDALAKLALALEAAEGVEP